MAGDENKQQTEEKPSLLGSLANKTVNLVESVGNKASKVKEAMLDYVPEVDFDYIEDKLSSLGYRVPKIEIKMSIPPAVSMEIDLEKSVIDKVAQEKLVEDIDFEDEKETETNKVLVKIIQGLDYAAKINDKIKFKNKKMSRVIVEGSLIPSVKLVYLDADVSADNYLRDKN